MEILFIWLENYKNIKKQGFNFSSKFFFTCDSKETDGGIEIILSVEENEYFISNFFENTYIRNVTAIIGQNGTGKSNILDFIKESLPDGSAGIQRNSILVLKETFQGATEYVVYYPKSYKFEFKNSTTLKFKLKEYDNIDGKFFSKTSEDYPHFKNTFFIHYSNVFDLRAERSAKKMKIYGEEEPITVNGFFNISTNSHLSSDAEYYGNESNPNIDRFDAYKASEIRRNIEFVCSNFKSELGFEYPTTLYLFLINYDEEFLKRNKENEIQTIDIDFDPTKKDEKEDSVVNKIIAELESIPHVPIVLGTEEGDHQMFYNSFLRSAFFNFIRTYSFVFENNSKYFVDAPDQNLGIINFFRTIQSTAKLAGNIIEKANNVLNLYFHFEENINKKTYNTIRDTPYCLAIPVKEKDKLSIENLVAMYIRSKSITDYLEFRWRNLSSGEQSMLTMLSRFHALKAQIGSDNLNKLKDIIILIDEGDTYFHPEWQRRYLNIVLDYIPKIFNGHKIQFILTSNAPFLASDLPNSNLIFLKKGREGTENVMIVENRNKMNQTFAANIHSLLSNSFFLENGLMGEFSISKLEKVHDKIKKKYWADLDYIKKHINIIGEPLIKNQFQKMYENSFGIATSESIEEKIQRLQKELLEAQELKRQEDENSRKG